MAFWACVKVPAAIIRPPTCTIALTLPSRMFGVQATGVADTTWDCGNCVALLGPAVTVTSTAEKATSARIPGPRLTVVFERSMWGSPFIWLAFPPASGGIRSG